MENIKVLAALENHRLMHEEDDYILRCASATVAACFGLRDRAAWSAQCVKSGLVNYSATPEEAKENYARIMQEADSPDNAAQPFQNESAFSLIQPDFCKDQLYYKGRSFSGWEVEIKAFEISTGEYQLVAVDENGEMLECQKASSYPLACSEFFRMLQFFTTGTAEGMYTRDDWTRDRSFSARPGQEVSPEIYDEMLEVLPPYSLPRRVAEEYGAFAGFMVSEPVDFDPDTKQLRYNAFICKNGHYYFAGRRCR